MLISNKKLSENQYKQMPAKPIRLIFEVLLCLLLIIPAILWSVFKLFIKSSRKNVKGQVVLVSAVSECEFLTVNLS